MHQLFERKYFAVLIFQQSGYYPGGMLMPGRKYSTSSYRYGFNSHEKSDEIAGEGNHTTALFGEYDTRLVRRWNPDPKPSPSLSFYSVFGNNPIWRNDIALDTPRPLTTHVLRDMARKNGVTGTGVTFNRKVGKAFEAVSLASQSTPENTQSFPSSERSKATAGSSSVVVPDGVGTVTETKTAIGLRWPPIYTETEVYPNSSLFEVKAVDGFIRLSSSNYQIQGELDVVKNSPAGKIGRGTMTFITTANTFIAADVIAYAQKNSINLYQVFAFQETDDNSIRFTPPIPLTNPTQYSRSINITPLAKAYQLSLPYFLTPNKATTQPATTVDPEEVQ